MADPEASDHPPAKRFKHLHQEDPINGRHDDAAQPPLMAAGASFHHLQSSSNVPAHWSSQNSLFDPSWSWHSSPPSLQQQQQLQDRQPPPRLILEIQDEAEFHQSAVWDSISPAASNTAPSGEDCLFLPFPLPLPFPSLVSLRLPSCPRHAYLSIYPPSCTVLSFSASQQVLFS